MIFKAKSLMSPPGAALTIAMLREEAQGQTEKEIREVLQATKISDSDAVTLATVKKRRRAAAPRRWREIHGYRVRASSWNAPVLWRFPLTNPHL
jgi:hypothetical protein